jgi:hypothetical protein
MTNVSLLSGRDVDPAKLKITGNRILERLIEPLAARLK